jgi:peptide/nickel transport system substrate-binding protein
MVDRVDVVNDHEIVIVLKYAFVPFLSHLAHGATSIWNQKAVTEMGPEPHSRAPVGTGPMKFVNWVTGASIELTRFDDYHGGRVPVRNMTLRFIADPTTRLRDLETGGLDLMYNVATPDVTRIERDNSLQMIRSMNLSTNYIGFNTQKAPFNDVRVRHAVAHALDLQAMVRNVYMGTGAPGRGPINPMVWASTADRLQPYEYNPARARQLLAEAGYPNGFNTTFVFNEGNTQRMDSGEIAANMLRQVGINVDVRSLEWGAYLDMTGRGDQDMYILGWVTVTGDPDYGLYGTFHSSGHGAAGNRSFYTNPEVDRLLDAGRTETNPTRREQIYAQVQQIIRDDLPWIFQWNGEDLSAARANVKGFKHSPTGHHQLWNLYTE